MPQPTLSFDTGSSSTLAQSEGQSGSASFTYTVTRTGDLGSFVSVAWRVLAGTGSTPAAADDFTGGVFPSGMVSFVQGQTSASIVIAVAGDTIVEPEEDFILSLDTTGVNFAFERTVTSGRILNDDIANRVPVAVVPVANQSATETQPFTVTLPSGAFRDEDGDSLTYSATQSNGSPLPSWLTFTPGSLSFSGTPPSDSADLSLRVTASDNRGGNASLDFALLTPAANRMPVVSVALPDQTANEGQGYSWTMPSGSFTDPDNDTLTWSVDQSDGSPLPSWLTFDSANRSFSGTPAFGTSDLNIRVTVSDGRGGSVSDIFALSTPTPNRPPVASGSIPEQRVTEGLYYSYSLPRLSSLFSDADSDTLSYRVTQRDGSALPYWLYYSTSGQSLSGYVPTNAADLALRITASDPRGASATLDFSLLTPAPNRAPLLAAALPDQAANEGQSYSWAIPSSSFSDPNGDTLTWSASQTNGSPLPSWLSFDPTSRSFSGTPAFGTSDLSIRVMVNDGRGGSVSDDFTLSTPTPNRVPVVSGNIPEQRATEGMSYSYTLPMASLFSDTDGDRLSYSVTQSDGTPLPSWLSYSQLYSYYYSNYRLSGYVPSNAADLSLRVTASDNRGGSAALDFSLLTPAPNRAPQVTASSSTPRGVPALTTLPAAGLFTTSDPDNDAITRYRFRLSNYSSPGLQVLVNGTAVSGQVEVEATNLDTVTIRGGTQAAPSYGSSYLFVQAFDGSAWSGSASCALITTEPNRPPRPGSDRTIAIREDAGPTALGLAAPVDPDGDSMTITVTAVPSEGAVTLSDGSPVTRDAVLTTEQLTGLRYATEADFNGAAGTFTYSVADGQSGATSRTLTLSVTPVNDTPVATGKEQTLPFNGTLAAASTVDVTDADGDQITRYRFYDESGASDGARLRVNGVTRAAGNWVEVAAVDLENTVIQAGTRIGRDSFRVRVFDGAAWSVPTNFVLNTIRGNQAPVAGAELPDQAATIGRPFRYQVPATAFTDPDGDTLTWSAAQADGTAVPGWLLFNPASRTFSGTAPSGATALALVVTVQDSAGGTATQSFTLTPSEPPPPDNAGNTLAEARALGRLALNGSTQQQRDFVGAVDPLDYYRLILGARATVQASLRDMTGSINLTLLTVTERALAASSFDPDSTQTLERPLDPGTYYLLAGNSADSGSRYRLDLTATAVDGAGDTPETARDMGSVRATPARAIDWVGGSDRDFYRFTVATAGVTAFQLEELTANADMALLASDGSTVIQRSTTSGATPDTFARALDAGTYFVQVSTEGRSETSYRLNLSTRVPDNAGNSLAQARDLSLLRVGDRARIDDFVGEDDPADYYRFQVGGPTLVSARVSELAGAIDMAFLRADTGAEIVSQASSTTQGLLRRTLPEGTYALRLDPQTLATSYALVLNATPVDSAPASVAEAARRSALTITSSARTVRDFVGSSDPTDTYRITLPSAGAFRITLNGLAARSTPSLRLLDRTGTRLAFAGTTSSSTSLTATTAQLAAGTYYAQISAGRSDSYYQMTLRRSEAAAAVLRSAPLSAGTATPATALLSTRNNGGPTLGQAV